MRRSAGCPQIETRNEYISSLRPWLFHNLSVNAPPYEILGVTLFPATINANNQPGPLFASVPSFSLAPASVTNPIELTALEMVRRARHYAPVPPETVNTPAASMTIVNALPVVAVTSAGVLSSRQYASNLSVDAIVPSVFASCTITA